MFLSKDSIFWVACPIFIALTTLFYQRRKYQLLYTKPSLKILHVITEKGEIDGYSCSFPIIWIEIRNPSSFENIVSYKIETLKSFHLKTPIDENFYNDDKNRRQFTVERFSISTHRIDLNEKHTNKYKNTRLILTLSDLKGKKSSKVFKFSDKNITAYPHS